MWKEENITIDGGMVYSNLNLCVFSLNFYYYYYITCRYDVALGLNTFGVKHVINFAKKCINLRVLVHVSTGLYMNMFYQCVYIPQ